MDSRRNEDAFFGLAFFAVRVLVLACDGNVLAPVASQCAAQGASIDKVLGKPISLYPGQIVAQVGVGVGETVRKIHLIVAFCESVRPRQRVVAAIEAVTFALESVLIVGDVAAYTVPAQLLWSIS